MYTFRDLAAKDQEISAARKKYNELLRASDRQDVFTHILSTSSTTHNLNADVMRNCSSTDIKWLSWQKGS